MNNKSTENLIESCESVEELHVPPLDLQQLEHDEPQKSTSSNQPNSDSGRSLNNRPRRIQTNNFFVEKSTINESETKFPATIPPIPAARKLSLPPIASKRNGKATKETSNQLTRNQHIQSNDTIRIISERPSPKSNTKAHSDDSESDTDIGQLKQSLHEKANKIELKTFGAHTKNHLKSAFGVPEINEETTSFISYEEKHEKEDNSEHLVSNHSSVNSKELQSEQGVKNAAFVQDDNAEMERPNEIDSKSKSKKKDKKSKEKKPKKEKYKKRSTQRRTEQTTEPTDVVESENDVHHSYDFKHVIGRPGKDSLLKFMTIYNIL